jgi:hypothetical protein
MHSLWSAGKAAISRSDGIGTYGPGACLQLWPNVSDGGVVSPSRLSALPGGDPQIHYFVDL